MFMLDGKVALVTGGSSGIGAEIALAMARAGAHVLASGRDQQRLRDTVEGDSTPGEISGMAIDLCETDALQAIVAETIKRYGRLDTLIHSAGVFDAGKFDDVTRDSFRQQMSINVEVPFFLTQAAVPFLLQTKGAVIFVSSICGYVGFPQASAYCCTKGAIESLTKALACELAPDIRVNAIAPGNVLTPINDELLADEGSYQSMIANTPAGRFATVEEIAPAAVFLASDEARFIHGTSMLLDGGWTAR